MDIETSGAIKLFFPNPSLSLVYFEALANALDAGATDVSIDIDVQAYDKPDTLKITVTDNGDGFTDENFDRFKTLLKPRDKFHKGIGRLVFLNYFDRVEVVSTRDKWQRKFAFKEGFDGNAPLQELGQVQEAKTTLTFTGFAGARVKSYDDLRPDAIKPLFIEQFLPTLDARKRDGKAFKISISLNTTESNAQKEFFPHEVTITSNDLPSMTTITIQDDSLDAFTAIDMHYHVESVSGRGSLLIAFSIDGRTIPVNLISPSSFPPNYMGVFLFESEMFHSNADSSRQKLVLPDGMQEASLFRVLRREIGKILAEKIPQITQKNEEVKEQFEEKFPHLLGYFEEDTVGLIDRDDALAIAQQRFFRVQKEVLQSEKLTDAAYEKSLEMSSRTLTEYILYRDKIIGRMKEMTTGNTESEIHNLIVPRFKEFSQEVMSVRKLMNRLPKRNAASVRKRFRSGGLLTEKGFQSVIEAVRQLSPQASTLLERFSKARSERIRQLSAKARGNLAQQKEALLTALSISGISRDPVQEWAPSAEAPASFLDGLPSVRLREDPMVVNDLQSLPGFEVIKTYPHGAAVFESEETSERLTVILANRLPLEEQTGADLIYFNETYQSFVMVQYKAMEREDRRDGPAEAVYRPDAQLKDEIARMDAVLDALRVCEPNTNIGGFRLAENPFFLKLCPRLVFNPDSVGLVPGMYLPLDYWKLLQNDPGIRGPKDGLRITYDNAKRHFDNTSFITVASKAWVGTTPSQSHVLQDVIRETLETRKAVLIAIKPMKVSRLQVDDEELEEESLDV